MVQKEDIEIGESYRHKTLGEMEYDNDCFQLDSQFPNKDQVRLRTESFIISTVYLEDIEPMNSLVCEKCLRPK